jgi:N-acetylneuraminate synthase
MTSTVLVGDRPIGPGSPTYVVAEIGINHNGDVQNALRLIDAAVLAGADAVKFQKRTPELCVPKDQRDVVRDTPWGPKTYLEYRHIVELDHDDFTLIDKHCRDRGIDWFASCWDEPSVDFIDEFDPICYKAASASLTDIALLKHTASKRKPMILSSGMSTLEEIDAGVAAVGDVPLILCHSTSTYPCPPTELNLKMLDTLRSMFPETPVGYSGHEVGLQTTLAAVVMGACFVERHVTLDRAMWGTDQAASIEPAGLMRLVRDIRVIEDAIGDGVKRVYESELPIRAKLRRS